MLVRFLLRARLWITLVWLVAFAALAPLAAGLPERLSAESVVAESESEEVAQLIAAHFDEGGDKAAWLIVTGVPDLAEEPGRELLDGIALALQAKPWVTDLQSYLNTREELFLGAKGEGGLLRVSLAGGDRPEDLAALLKDAAGEITAQQRDRFPALGLAWTGDFLVNADMLTLSERDVRTSEQRAVPLTALLLAWAFGALVAMAFPLVIAVLSIVTVFGAVAVITDWWQPSLLLQNVVSLLGLALGIDYTLLMVSRFREELRAGLDAVPAAERTLRHAGRAVVLSGSAVALSFCALAIVPIDELRSVALGGLLVTLCTVALTTTLVPGWLCWLGPRVNALRIPFLAKQAERANGHWRRWTAGVTRWPLGTLILVGLPLVALSLPALDLEVTPVSRDWMPDDLASAQGLQAMEQIGRGNLIDRLPLLYRAPEGEEILGAEGWQALTAIQNHLEGDPRIQKGTSVPTMMGDDEIDLEMLQLFAPTALEGRFLAEQPGLALFDIVPSADLSLAALSDLAQDLRGLGQELALPGEVLVGGFPAYTLDYEQTVAAWFPWVLALVLGSTFLALFIGFRSVLIPIKAVLLNLVSVAAAFGALQLVFVEGWGAGLLGLAAPIEGVFPAIPIIVFCVVFGISMDYEVFLLTRVAEARRKREQESESIVEGVVASGHLITSAAAIMIVVFASVVFGDFLAVQMMGFTLAVAVLIDATAVRLVLGPALIRLAGRWNWWPGDTWRR